MKDKIALLEELNVDFKILSAEMRSLKIRIESVLDEIDLQEIEDRA